MLTIFPVRLGKPSNTTLRIFPGRRGRVCILQSRSSLARCAARRICIFTTSFLYKYIFPTENRCSSCLYKSIFVLENVEKVALSGAGPPVKTRGKRGRYGHRLKRGHAGKMFYRLSFILSIPNMNADSKLDRELGSRVAGHACRRAAVVATCESKANFFSKLYREFAQCSVVLLEKNCIFHTFLEHIGCPKKKLRTECCWSPKLGGQLPNFLGHIVDTLQLLQ